MEEKYGNVKVDNEVLASIAAIAARKVPGVHRISTSIVGDIVQWLRKSPDVGIKIIIGEDEVSFELRVVIDYGVNIPEVTYQIQKAIKEEVERISGLKVGNVDVVIHGIHFPKNPPEEEEEK
ncbi:MAG: Asp23/Gls24 family envelope stress response protein [Candidatus Ratteibacteria bacterium]|nr:Asp23/Gls24 family envelope stress response protein [Candidatus Ratteibacteria bacterium]